MKILVAGATGFIASQIVTDLLTAGHEVTCCVRNASYAKNIFPDAHIIRCDFTKDTSPDLWLPRLKDIEVVINCVGILYHPMKKNIWTVHYDTPKALFDACVTAGVPRVIQFSALGIETSLVEYAKSKKACDDYLLSLPLIAIILRPSLVYGRGSYGGTSLFRGLVGLPWVIPVPGQGEQVFQPIALEDLSHGVLKLTERALKKSVILHAVGPACVKLKELLPALRAWLGFAKAKLFFVPLKLIRFASFAGDLIPHSSLNTTAYKMMMQNNMTTSQETARFQKAIGFKPREFLEGLYAQPSTVQDHWHAHLYFLKPLLGLSIAFIWIFTALCSAFWYPTDYSYALLANLSISEIFQPYVLYGASFLDFVIGVAVLLRYKTRVMTMIQLGIIFVYTAIITWHLPFLWFDTFGAIAKNIPFMVAILIYAAMDSDR